MHVLTINIKKIPSFICTQIYEARKSSQEGSTKRNRDQESETDSNKRISQVNLDKESPPEEDTQITTASDNKSEKGAKYARKFGRNAYAKDKI